MTPTETRRDSGGCWQMVANMKRKNGIVHLTFLVLVVGVISVILGLQDAVHPSTAFADSLVVPTLSAEEGANLKSAHSTQSDCRDCCIERCTACPGFHHSPAVANEFLSAQVMKPIMASKLSEIPLHSYRKPFFRPPIFLA